MTGKDIIKQWEANQTAGKYSSYDESMSDLALMIDSAIPKPIPPFVSDGEYEYEESAYRREQRTLREAGFNAYNCDNVDEFPTWG